jgi:hypothetical protein
MAERQYLTPVPVVEFENMLGLLHYARQPNIPKKTENLVAKGINNKSVKFKSPNTFNYHDKSGAKTCVA